MSNLIDNEINALHKEVIRMGTLCEDAINNATTALLENDKNSAEVAIRLEEEINEKEREIEDLCLTFLLKQHPVARDLRKISATLKMLTDLERIGDQARDIAEIVQTHDLTSHCNNPHISDLANSTSSMVNNIISAHVKNDMLMCEQVIVSDTVVDNLFEKVKNDIIEMIQKDTTIAEDALFLLMIAKYYERIGDHATNIAEWVEFSITGKHRNDN